MQTQRLSWRDPPLRWLLLLTLALSLGSWWLQRGYPLADAVEFMDRAKSWVAGEELSDARTVRSFAFSLFFVPFFLLARALELEDPRAILVAARLFEVALTLGLVFACARLGERVAGRSAGLAVGCVVALNPVVLQYSVHPISGIAAALCIALGLERLIVRGERRDGPIGGLWLGLAFLMAYQSLLVALAVFVVLVLRDRWSARASWLGLAAGLAVAMGVQLVLDRAVYGSWQGSLWRYLLQNVGYVIVHFLTELGASKTAGELYRQISALRGEVYVTDDSITRATMRFGQWWYLISAPRFFVWPLLALFLAGVLRAITRPRWTSTLGVVALLLVLAIMAKKGDKSLRLCLPLIPLCVPLFAVAWEWLAERASSRWLARGALVAALPLVFIAFTSARPRAHAAYWDAADWIDARAEESGASRARVASAYDWAVFLRFGARVQQVKLPEPLDRWKKLAEPERERELAGLESVDWLILHQPLFVAQSDLAQLLAPRFEVAAAFYDQDEAPELGAVLVLRRADEGGLRLFDYSKSTPSPRNPRVLEFKTDASSEALTFLGHDLARVSGSDWWWITYHWKLPSSFAELEVRDRISAPDEKNTWQNDHALGRGSRPSNPDVRYLSEGFLLVPSDVDLGDAPKFRPLGGAYRRGDLIPVRLWLEVRDIASGRALEVFRDDSTAPVRAEFTDPSWRWSAGGYRFSKDDLVQAASFFLPVHSRAFARDDGKPIPE